MDERTDKADKTGCSGYGKVGLAFQTDRCFDRYSESRHLACKADINVVVGDLGTEHCVPCMDSSTVNHLFVVDDLRHN